jgi:hypothetical protein
MTGESLPPATHLSDQRPRCRIAGLIASPSWVLRNEPGTNLAALWNGGASRVVLIPAVPDPRAALDSLARLLG